MSEPRIIEINKTGNFDGSTSITLTRDQFVERGQRYYTTDLAGAAGVVEADIFGLFTAHSLKLVGVSGVSHNPQSTVKVVTPYGSGRIRQQVQLGPTIKYVVMFPTDRLVITTQEITTTVQLVLVVNEMTEADHVRFANRAPNGATRPNDRKRYQLQRTTGTAFVSSGTSWSPTFVFNTTTQKMVSTDNGTGSIPAVDLSRRGPEESIYVRVRFAGTSDSTTSLGSVDLVDGQTGRTRSWDTGLVPMQWSRSMVLGADDRLGLTAEAAVAGELITADIDVVHVLPGEHLSELWRWESNL